MKVRVDVAVIGSGFAGSILAWILAKSNVRVALIDSAIHPRFAIGESSTPIADAILRRLGLTYGIQEFASLSTWGQWQRDHPDVACGRKRGFSYYVHERGKPFCEASTGDQSLLVAASQCDAIADTHWYRPEVDRFFFEHAIAVGAIDFSGHRVVAQQQSVQGSGYKTHCTARQPIVIESDWVIDASGQAGVLARLTRANDRSGELRTCTHSTYGHYADVASWTEYLEDRGTSVTADPFNGDDAAQHHLLGQGWLWMLRFNNGLTSVGYTAPMSQSMDWSGYPSIERLMQNANLVDPARGPRTTGRLQRFFDPVIDRRRIMLPTSAATIDPLHSTGIAHALAGVQRVLGIIMSTCASDRETRVDRYRRAVLEEVRLIDLLVSTAYETMHDFRRFTVACMVYFAGAIRCEERIQRGDLLTHLWNVDDAQYASFARWACELLTDYQRDDFEDSIRSRLGPWNSAGLMDGCVDNRYAYTATKQG